METIMDDIPHHISNRNVRFLYRFRLHLRAENKAYTTEKTYVSWVKRFILFHNKRHPNEMDAGEIDLFLSHLAIERHVSPVATAFICRENSLFAISALHRSKRPVE